MTSKLPPWTGDDAAMLRWLDGQIEDIYAVEIDEANRSAPGWKKLGKSLGLDNQPDAHELAAARRGDLGPLTRKYPHLAQAGVLRLPKQRRGDTFARRRSLDLSDNKSDRASAAARDVAVIRRLWQEYHGKKNRKGGERSAEWFAAKLWRVDENDVVLAIKRMGSGA